MKAIYSSCLAAAILACAAPAQAAKLDTRIEQGARDSYVFRTYLNGEDITVTSVDGAVTLTGSVAENSRKSLAQDTVASLPGVKSVENRLEVKGAPTASSDAWLSDKLKITLLFHRSVSSGKTEVFGQGRRCHPARQRGDPGAKRPDQRICKGRRRGQGDKRPDDRVGDARE